MLASAVQLHEPAVRIQISPTSDFFIFTLWLTPALTLTWPTFIPACNHSLFLQSPTPWMYPNTSPLTMYIIGLTVSLGNRGRGSVEVRGFHLWRANDWNSIIHSLCAKSPWTVIFKGGSHGHCFNLKLQPFQAGFLSSSPGYSFSSDVFPITPPTPELHLLPLSSTKPSFLSKFYYAKHFKPFPLSRVPALDT